MLGLALLGPTPGTFRSAAADVVEREILLGPGYNQVVYTGPQVNAAEVAEAVPGLRSVLRWDALAQGYKAYSPLLPAAGNSLERIAPGDALWVDVATRSQWTMPVVEGPGTRTLHAGWNLVGWTDRAVADTAALFAPVGDRLRAAYRFDAATGFTPIYSPLLPAALASPGVERYDLLWLQVSTDPPLTWQITPEALLLVAGDFALPPARTLQEVEQAVVYVASSGQAGGGFIISDTQVLTAAHVVGTDLTVSVRFPGQNSIAGRVTARDTRLDVAVITVDGFPEGSRRLEWQGGRRPSLTTPAWAWGFPYESRVVGAGFAMAVTVSSGIVSAHRLRNAIYFLQTDAAINPGNSGGPLTTVDGRAVGLNTSVLTVDGEDAEGLNFALDLAQHQDEIRALLSR